MIREKDYIVLTASYGTPHLHKHLALHLLFGLDSRLDCRIEGQRVLCDGICIDSNAYHTASVQKGKMLMVLVETSSDLAEQMRRCYLNAQSGRIPFAVLPKKFATHIRQAVKEEDASSVKEYIRTLDGNDVPGLRHMDERVRSVLKWMEDQEEVDENAYRELAEVSCLSLSRLSHLFKEQTGSSLAGYLAWVKLEKAYAAVLAGNNLTQAAAHAGFSSPSHMSATFRRMFGITFSDFLASV